MVFVEAFFTSIYGHITFHLSGHHSSWSTTNNVEYLQSARLFRIPSILCYFKDAKVLPFGTMYRSFLSLTDFLFLDCIHQFMVSIDICLAFKETSLKKYRSRNVFFHSFLLWSWTKLQLKDIVRCYWFISKDFFLSGRLAVDSNQVSKDNNIK